MVEWALLLTDIQRSIRKHHNENFTISFDCASPFLATANGQIYVQTEIKDREKWLYRMLPSIDDKKYASDSRLFQDAVVQDGHFKSFTTSPVMDGVKIKDICIYAPGDLNKINKEGRTSWDSFTYAIMMGHNVWQHVNSVQEANRQYDAGLCPEMLVQEEFDRVYFKDVVEEIFSTSDKGKALKIIKEYNKFWMAIPGTRGAIGKKAMNAATKSDELCDISVNFTKEKIVLPVFVSNYAALFDEPVLSEHGDEFTDNEINKLDDLEDSLK